jgi:hypothetical protein
MTDEEINRKFDVVAGHLATLATSLQKSDERQERTDAQIGVVEKYFSNGRNGKQ